MLHWVFSLYTIVGRSSSNGEKEKQHTHRQGLWAESLQLKNTVNFVWCFDFGGPKCPLSGPIGVILFSLCIIT